MYKKIGIVFAAIIILLFPVQQVLEQNKAYAITAKVATKVATQAFKEGVKDIAKEKAFFMALDEVGKIYDSKNTYAFKDGYDGYCVEVKKPDGTCDKPVQIKKELNATDQDNLDKQVTKSMDNKLGNPLYSTKFGKWLDWVVPIYAISAAGVVVDYAINQEDSIAGMMNEIAMDALQGAGIIIPADTVAPVLKEGDDSLVTSPGEYFMEKTATNTVSVKVPFSSGTLAGKTIVYQNDILGDSQTLNTTWSTVNRSSYSSWGARYSTAYETLRIWDNAVHPESEVEQTTLLKNGQVINEHVRDWANDSIQFPGGANGYWHIPTALVTPEPMKTVMVQFKGGKTISSFETFGGDIYTMEAPLYSTSNEGDNANSSVTTSQTGVQVGTKVTVYERTVNLDFTPYEPKWAEEIPLMPVQPIEQSNFYNSDEKKFYFPPMDSVSYIDTATNEPVTIVKNPETGETSFTDGSGVPVHEDSISVMPGTGFTPAPEGGGMTYTPTNPTPENPTKEPVTITPTQPVAPPPVEPPPVEEPPLSEFPEGESCQEKLKFPIFSPLKEQFSTSFPFSIPWDMERAINAAFAEIGNDKPSFTLDLAFMGDKKEIVITVPKMFDDWKPFTDTLLLLTFDILIMFGVYRFVKGAGS